MINYTPRLFVVVGSPASGKDELIKAVNILGSIHAQIVPKYTNRDWRWNDDEEMICERIPDNNGNMVRNPDYDIGNCDIIYCNYGTIYGIKTNDALKEFDKEDALFNKYLVVKRGKKNYYLVEIAY